MDNSLLITPDKGTFSASYDGTWLTLQASGEVDTGISGITFVQLPAMLARFGGPVAFELRGWNSGAIKCGGKKRFYCTLRFTIDLRLYNTSVVIYDGHNPDGTQVRLKETGDRMERLSPDHRQVVEKSIREAEVPRDKYPRVSRAEPVLITLDRTKPFLFQNDPVYEREHPGHSRGYVSISYDRTVLELQTIPTLFVRHYWQFNALQTGWTTVLVSVWVRATNTIEITPYILNIKNDPYLASAPSHCFSLQSPPSSWLEFVDFGYSLIKIEWPTAQILEVRATPISESELDRPEHVLDLCKLTILCHVPEVGDEWPARTVSIQSTGRMTWQGPGFKTHSWTGSEVIPWKHPISMDILESYKILCKSKLLGDGGGIRSCTLRHPSGPDVTQPYYIYTLRDSRIIGIGIKDKKIRSFGVGNLSLVPAELKPPSICAPVMGHAAQMLPTERQLRIEEHLKRGCIQPTSPQASIESAIDLPEESEAVEEAREQNTSTRARRSRTTAGRVEKAPKKKGKKEAYTWMRG